MGRMLGAFDSDELDRPDLNKCPDCGCYFADETCTLCGKICPEEMRAGHRAPPKKAKKRKNGSGRVQFIAWYHSWWFMTIMLILMPIAGIILLVTSPQSTKVKVAVVAAALAWTLLISNGIGWYIVRQFLPSNEPETADTMPVEESHRADDAASAV